LLSKGLSVPCDALVEIAKRPKLRLARFGGKTPESRDDILVQRTTVIGGPQAAAQRLIIKAGCNSV
jgi:hypothetical protein